MESKEESSSTSTSLIFLQRWRLQLEDRKKSDTTSDFVGERLKIQGKIELKRLRRSPRMKPNLMRRHSLKKI